MTQTEFQHRYHDYVAKSRAEAEAEIAGMELVEGDIPEVVNFGPLGFGLMLRHAARFLGV